MISRSLFRELTDRHRQNNNIEKEAAAAAATATGTTLSSSTLTIHNCLDGQHHRYTCRILKLVQQTRRGLLHITQLCDQLSNNAVRWTSSDIMTQLLTSHTVVSLLRPQLMETAMNCVELAVASTTAMLAFFETFLSDLDVATDGWGGALTRTTSGTTSSSSSPMVFPSLPQLQYVHRLATAATKHTRTLQGIAVFQQHVLQDMEGVVSSYYYDHHHHHHDHNVQIPSTPSRGNGGYDDNQTAAEEAAAVIVLKELQGMHQRIAVGLLMVAELALQWNVATATTTTCPTPTTGGTAAVAADAAQQY